MRRGEERGEGRQCTFELEKAVQRHGVYSKSSVQGEGEDCAQVGRLCAGIGYVQGSWMCAIERLHKREKAMWRSRLKRRLRAQEKAACDGEGYMQGGEPHRRV